MQRDCDKSGGDGGSTCCDGGMCGNAEVGVVAAKKRSLLSSVPEKLE
jgi:hypothetical protein